MLFNNYLSTSMMQEMGKTATPKANPTGSLATARPLSADNHRILGVLTSALAPALRLAGNNLDALAVNRNRQNFSTSLDNSGFHTRASIRFDQQDDTPPATRTAHFSR